MDAGGHCFPADLTLGDGTVLHQRIGFAVIAARHLLGDALAHSDQTVPGAGTVTGAGTVVCDLELDVVPAVTEKHPGMCGAGVFEDVCQRLLHDPVGGDVNARREFRASPSTAMRSGSPAACTCSTTLSSSFRLGCGVSTGTSSLARRLDTAYEALTSVLPLGPGRVVKHNNTLYVECPSRGLFHLANSADRRRKHVLMKRDRPPVVDGTLKCFLRNHPGQRTNALLEGGPSLKGDVWPWRTDRVGWCVLDLTGVVE